MNIKKNFILLVMWVVIFAPLVIFAAAATNFLPGATSTIEFSDGNFGKVNLAPTNGGVTVSQTEMSGYAWGENVGWINFGPFVLNNVNDPSGVTINCSGGVGTASGYAWGQNTGWINFGPFTGGNTAQQVQIDSSGNLSGFAWAQNAGWLDFSGAQTSFSCSSGGGGGGGGPTSPNCSLNANPIQITTPNSPVTLSWTLSGSGTLSFSLLNTTYTTNGSVVVNPLVTTNYVGTVTNGTSTHTCSQTVVVSPVQQTLGCMDIHALNYNHLATVDNGRCVYDSTVDWELEYTLDSITPITSTSCVYFKEFLKRGSKGIEVAKVQNFLNKYNNETLKLDGVYGKTTEDAVRRFQIRHYDDIITPWGKYITGVSTGRWYKTTRGTANVIVGCDVNSEYLELPKVTHSFTQTAAKLFNNFLKVVSP